MLELKNVSIRYLVGDYKDIGLKDYVVQKLRGRYMVKELLAVNNVSFRLEKGDILGIVGKNGAGKSTLLKAVSGIMRPSEGEVLCDGNVVPLLELGSGFDGDLTVRENAYLRGAILGYTRQFMDEMYQEIIQFAELEDCEHREFKQLSSGMKARLAFALAAQVEPDVLILDEVLSVGDGAFKLKSERKIKEIIKGGVITILVSHSLDQIRGMCNKVLWLHQGDQKGYGDTKRICDQYESFLYKK